MDPLTATIVTGLLQQAGGAIFAVAQRYTMRRLGLDSSQSAPSYIKPLLDDYLKQLKGRLDEDRIAKLYGAFSKLMDAPRSVVKQGLLVDALDKFHEVSQIPQQGITGDQSNAQLRCMAFVGMAASYMMLQDQPVLIAEKMVEAVRADANTAKQWLGDDLVNEIVSKLPPPTIICPKCGFQNPAGSQFCNRDGHPLNSRQEQTIPQSGSTGRANVNPGLWKSCPVCGTKMPLMRVPKTRQQALWGGWTCSTCGTELDRRGRPRSS
jgi:predicted RNA-binding Zn-ribbon protein involved in translation (DUF1610 family)